MPDVRPPADVDRKDRKSRAVSYLWSAIKLCIVAGLMIWIVGSADTSAVFAAMKDANLWLIGLAVAMQVLGAAIMAARWRLLLEVRAVTPGFPYLFTATVSAFFFRQFLPSVVGGDAIRSFAAWRAGASPGFSALSLVADRLFGLLALILFLLVASVFMTRIALDLPASGPDLASRRSWSAAVCCS